MQLTNLFCFVYCFSLHQNWITPSQPQRLGNKLSDLSISYPNIIPYHLFKDPRIPLTLVLAVLLTILVNNIWNHWVVSNSICWLPRCVETSTSPCTEKCGHRHLLPTIQQATSTQEKKKIIANNNASGR